MVSRGSRDQGGICETVFAFIRNMVIFWGLDSEILKPEQPDMQ